LSNRGFTAGSSLAAAALFLAVSPSFSQAAPARDPNADIAGTIASTVDAVQAANERRAAFSGALGLAARETEEPEAAEEYVFPGAPEGQPRWHYLTKPLIGSKAVRTRVPDGWRLDTTGETKDSAGFFSLRLPFPGGIMSRPKIDRHSGFSVHFRLAVRSENHVRRERAGVSVIVIGDDLQGVELGFWEHEVWAQLDDPLFTHGEGALFETAADVDYTLTLIGDRYELEASGRRVLEGPLKNYSSFGFPYDRRSFLFYGDDTGSAAADMELRSLRVEYGPPQVASLPTAGSRKK
jgi:hypothetical protein